MKIRMGLALCLLAGTASAASELRSSLEVRELVEASRKLQASIDAPHCYADVLLKNYGPGYPALIAQRQDYARAHGLTPWADYSQVDHHPVISHEKLPSGLAMTRDRTEAGYRHADDTLVIYDDADKHLPHELGHSLQRQALFAHEKNVAEASFALPAQTDAFSFYMARQSELEVRLQSLNRIYFRLNHRLIATPAEALQLYGLIGLDIGDSELGQLKARGVDVSLYKRKVFRKSFGDEDAASILDAFDHMRKYDYLHPGEGEYMPAALNILAWLVNNAPAHL